MSGTQDFPARYAKLYQGASEGKLDAFPARFVLDYLNREKFTGSISLSHREKRKKIWMYKGEVFRIQSNLIPELIGSMMCERGWLSETDLEFCLKLQRESRSSQKRLGEYVRERFGIKESELKDLQTYQSVSSLLQAMTWEEGDFETQSLQIKSIDQPAIPYREVVRSIQGLFELAPVPLGLLFKMIKPWQPKSSTVEFSQTPLWLVLAGCRLTNANGILSIRKQQKLFEIVIKNGLPLTLYEGTFGQPRQTVVIRQTSDQHERFFIDQLFRLFAFLKGSAHFRVLGDLAFSQEDEQLENLPEESHVTRSLAADQIAFELRSEFLEKQQTLWGQFKGLLRKWKSHLVEEEF